MTDTAKRNRQARMDRLVTGSPANYPEPLDPTKQHCPDGGACTHDCRWSCFRVHYCEPLTAAGWGARWPEWVDPAPRPGER